MDYTQLIKETLINDKKKLYSMSPNKAAISLVRILKEDIGNFDYNNKDYPLYLMDIFDILYNFIKDSRPLQIQFHNEFTYIHNDIRKLLHAKPKEETEENLNNYELLRNIINKMENTMLRLDYGNPVEYDPNKEEFISYIIFKLKYINIFSATCEKFPHIVNSSDKDGIPLAEKVLNAYLDALESYLSKENLGPIDDLIYFDKVLKIILNSKKVKIDNFNRTIMLEKVKAFCESHTYTGIIHKEKLSFFINDILNTLSGDESKVTLDYLSYKYEIHNQFKEAHNLEAERIHKQNKNIGRATTRRKIYTFDGEGAKELDDGLSLTFKDGIYHFGVHIADPGSYIPTSSILFDEASRRTTSLYMDDYCIPMYPMKLAGDTMSLNEGKNTYCMSFYFDIDAFTGELINFNIKNEICKIAGNCTYEHFDNCLDHGTEDKEFFDLLVNLTNLSVILKKVYNEEKLYKIFHPKGKVTTATSTIESAMIYTNYQVAKYFDTHELPFLYRCHTIDKNEKEKLAQLQERLREKEQTYDIVHNIEYLKNLYPRAKCSRINTGHYGLGIDYYTHTTSPLRRLHDNISMMCIKTFVLNPYTQDDIKRMNDYIDEIAEAINTKRSSAEDYEIQYLKLLYPEKEKKD